MCMFSAGVDAVELTRIFARPLPDGSQLLAYEMRVAHDRELAMILPLPTPVAAPDDAIEFIDLSGAADLFDRLDAVFVVGRGMPGGLAGTPRLLAVHEVGAFQASFVPRLADFARLDPRFRLPSQVWDQLPQYADHGFVVFALRPVGSGALHPVHPMAFRFPRRDPDEVFFPTVHVHDGAVHPTAEFDHRLYLQSDDADGFPDQDWDASHRPAPSLDGAAGELVVAGRPVYMRVLMDRLPNRDQVVSRQGLRIAGACAVKLDAPVTAGDAAALDRLLERLAAAPLGGRERPYDPRLPLVRDLHFLAADVRVTNGDGQLAFVRILEDGRRLQVRVAVSAAPDDDAFAAVTKAIEQFRPARP